MNHIKHLNLGDTAFALKSQWRSDIILHILVICI